jgi:hypothetical protein
MTSPTGRREIPYAQLVAQENVAWRIHQRMRRAMIAAGAKETFVDCFEMSSVDYATVEQRIMEAMREPVGTTIAPPVSGDSDEKS